MARATHMQTSFNGGELSAHLEGRVDLDRYRSSCHRLVNFLPTVEGPIAKRPGTRFVGEVADSTKRSKLIRFEYSRTQAYVLEFADEKIRVYKDGAVVLEDAHTITNITVGATTSFTTSVNHEWLTGDTVFISGVDGTLGPRVNGRTFAVTVTGAATFTIAFNSTGLTETNIGSVARVYEIVSPYQDTELEQLTSAQSADTLYLAHPSHFPRKLLRFDHDDWTLTQARGGSLGQANPITAITNANPGVFTTTRPHGLQGGSFVLLTRVQGMREVNGLFGRVDSVGLTETTFSLVGVNTTSFHAFGGGGKVAHTGLVQILSAHDWQAFSVENLNTDELMLASGNAATEYKKGSAVNLWSSTGRFTAAMVGEFVRLREVPAELYPKWEARTSLNTDLDSGALAVGAFAHWEGNVYELIAKGAGSTGDSPPIHEIEEEQQTDHRWTWQFAHKGDGFIQVTGFISSYLVQGRVLRQLPASCYQLNAVIDGGATSNTTDPVTITVASTAGLVDGDLVLLIGFAGATELNGLLVYVDVTSGTTFDCYYDVALTRGVDGINAGTAGDVILMTKATHRWSLGAWSSDSGHPRTVAFFEDRLWWASTSREPQTLWASESGVYESHAPHDELAGALNFTLNAQEMNAIEWIHARRGLVLGTQGGEFVATGQNPDESVSLENPLKPLRMTAHGVLPGVQPVQSETALLFVQRSGRKIREFVYDIYNSDEYRAPDISLLAAHLLLPGAEQMALQREPQPWLWVVMQDGSCAVCLYDRTQDVVGWARVVVGGVFGADAAVVESIAVIPHPDADQDQVWLIVKRTINGATRRYIETLEKPFLEGDALEDAFFVDAGLTYSGVATTSLTGLDHLEGQTVVVLAAGVYDGTRTVSAGAISGLTSSTKFQVGLPQGESAETGAVLVTNRLEFGGADGPAQGKFKTIRNLVLRLHQTGAGLLYGQGEDPAALDALRMNEGDDPTGAPITLYEGDTPELSFPGDAEPDGRVTVLHNRPTPCTLTALIVQGQVEDD